MVYTKESILNEEEFISNIYISMFTADLIDLSEKYRLYVTFAHYYTKCLCGKGLWND